MQVMVIGSGAREHALCRMISESPLLTKLWCAPGNPGIAQHAECISIEPTDIAALVAFAVANDVDLIVPGPESTLVAGITDMCDIAGIACCGPSRTASQLESSKSFTKELCDAANIPTARWQRFEDARVARAYVRDHGAPIVIKADGLAAGKGVVVATDLEEALAAIDSIMATYPTVVIEECLVGEEVSMFIICDGTTVQAFGVAKDYKRVGDGDTGANTGGMGAYSPVPFFFEELQDVAMERIILPALAELGERGSRYRGILYAGLMLTADGPKLIEFNVRFGDPECQALMLRLKSDLLVILSAASYGELHTVEIEWHDTTSVAVVIAAQGYPEASVRSEIRGLVAAPNVAIFHGGTVMEDGHLFGSGRALTVTATGTDLDTARTAAYAAVDAMDWPEGFCRRDIGIVK